MRSPSLRPFALAALLSAGCAISVGSPLDVFPDAGGDGTDVGDRGALDAGGPAMPDAGSPPVDVGLDAGGAPADRTVAGCTPSGAENTNAACADGVDNDCDGYVDCNDYNCSRTAAVTVCPHDGGTVDAARDTGVHDAAHRDVGACTASGAENTNARCSDGVDNDCDGYVDCNDFNCSRTAAVTVCHDAGP